MSKRKSFLNHEVSISRCKDSMKVLGTMLQKFGIRHGGALQWKEQYYQIHHTIVKLINEDSRIP